VSAPLPLGIFWGLRRLADDGGRFMLLDLRGADETTLADLVTLLAPFTTGVVLDAEPGRTVWRRWATPLFGRVEAAADDAAVAAAKRTGADAVLAPAACAEATAAAEIARLGDDDGAELRLGPGATGPWLAVTAGDAVDTTAAGLVGYLLTPAFWRQPLAAAGDAAARRLVIADDLAPRVQALNARVADLPAAAWLAR
jgi:hypothetical protein